MRLQPGGLVRHQGIGGGMAFIEAATRKFLHQIKYVRSSFRIDLMLNRSLDEGLALFGHFLRLLAHGPGAVNCAAQGIACQHLGDGNHLFLIKDDAVGGLENRRQRRMGILDAGVHAWWSMKSSTIPDCSGPGRNSATNATMSSKQSGCKRRIRSFHAAGFQLEHRRGLVTFQQIEGERVVQGIVPISSGDSPVAARSRLMVRTAQSMMVRVRRPRKSNFTNPADSTSSLSNWVTAPASPSSQYSGEKIGQGGRRDHHSTSMLADIARQPFQLAGQIDQGTDFLIVSYNRRSSASCSMALSKVMPISKGISLAIRST